MYYTTAPFFSTMNNPDLLLSQFYKMMAIALQSTIDEVQQIPKNFTGNRYSIEQQVVTDSKIFQFENLADGLKEYPKDEHGIVSNIRVYEGTAAPADLNKTPWIPGVVSPELLNGTFNIIQNGLVVMRDIPLAIFTRSEEQPYSGNWALISPFPWLGQTPMSIDITLFDVILIASNINLRIEISGPAFIS